MEWDGQYCLTSISTYNHQTSIPSTLPYPVPSVPHPAPLIQQSGRCVSQAVRALTHSPSPAWTRANLKLWTNNRPARLRNKLRTLYHSDSYNTTITYFLLMLWRSCYALVRPAPPPAVQCTFVPSAKVPKCSKPFYMKHPVRPVSAWLSPRLLRHANHRANMNTSTQNLKPECAWASINVTTLMDLYTW